ncbi:MAG: trypsin-like peptidase domain-containing protein, partial [Anaerolineales bacterium]|nr:trypsin-like peptidase domain-containing protein [Anaerolineales bacterium]
MKKTTLFVTLLILLALTACTSASASATTADTALAANTTQEVAAPAAAPVIQSDGPVADPLLSEQDTLINLYERVNPSVVSIQVTSSSNSLSGLPEDHPDLPDNFPDLPIDPQAIPQQSQGSGFIYDTDGHIITNNHVIADATDITVIFWDGTEADATLVGTDPDSDVAVIQVEDADPAMLQPVPVGDSEALKVGQFVIAIGNPFGLANSMTTGIVSGLGRMLPAGTTFANGVGFTIPDIIQTDAAINPGNSGG